MEDNGKISKIIEVDLNSFRICNLVRILLVLISLISSTQHWPVLIC